MWKRTATLGLAMVVGAAGALWLTPTDGATGGAAPDAARAASAFLKSLPVDKRASASFKLDSAERHDWHFVPKARVGVSLLDLDDTQAELVGPLLATALSPEGLLTARGVIKHEN